MVGALSATATPYSSATAFEFVFVTDLVAGGRAVGHTGQHLHQIPPVVGVRGGPGGDHAAQIAGHDDVGIGTADTGLRAFTEGIHPAGPMMQIRQESPMSQNPHWGCWASMAFPHGLDTVLPGLGV
jgi:hypothetical protein